MGMYTFSFLKGKWLWVKSIGKINFEMEIKAF